jgi:hypothetical protein
VPREAILAAVHEFDTLGREQFLAKYQYGHSTRYFIRIGGRIYDSKPIYGVAYGVANPEHGPLDRRQLDGGAGPRAAAGILRKLGFEIVEGS